MKYLEYNGVEGKHGGPFNDEIIVLEREKRSAGAEDREPNYQQVLDDHYSGNLPTQWDKPEIVKDEEGNVLNPEAEYYDDLKTNHEDITYDVGNSPVKQQEKVSALEAARLEREGASANTSEFGNTGNQELDKSAMSDDEKNAREESSSKTDSLELGNI